MYGFRQFVSNNHGDSEIISFYLNKPEVKISEIASHFGLSVAEIYRVLHANDISPNRVGVNHQKVQNLADLGWGIHEIARLTGYTPRNVRYILAKITENKK